MQIKLNEARKLINELEAKLNETSAHTVTARKVLDEWVQSGEAGLRKKGASALKQVRKRADSFTKALTKLEQNIATSLDKMSEPLEKKGSKKAAKKGTKKAAGKAASKSPVSASKKTATKTTPSDPKTVDSPKAESKKGAASKKTS